MSELSKRLLLLVSSIFLFLIFSELAVRIMEPREIMRYFFQRNDNVLDHSFIPNSHGFYETTEFKARYEINSLGLRDVEFPAAKPDNVFRILMLGDSFTEGIGVNGEQTFSKRLERMLDSLSLPVKCQVINAGVGSYSPLPEFIYLTRDGLRLKPGLVILNFDLSDVFDDIQYTKRARFDEKGIPVAIIPEADPVSSSWLVRALTAFKDFFKEHTQLYNFIRLRLDRYLNAARKEDVHPGDVRYDKYALLKDEYPHNKSEEWALTQKYILMIRDTLKARGIDFWMCVYPYGLQVSPREWSAGRKYWGFKADTVYSTKPQEYLAGFCKEQAIPVINLCDDFKDLSKKVYPLFYDYDGHWVAASHELAATAMYRVVRPYVEMQTK